MNYILFLIAALLVGCTNSEQGGQGQASELSSPLVIAFGSCARQDSPQPIFEAIADSDPSLYVWLGDIIYGDTFDMDTLRMKYEQGKQNPSYQKLLTAVPVIGVYDDHDYGVNDGGKEFPHKAASRDLLFEYLEVPNDDIARTRDGAYSSTSIDHNGHLVKIILLDTRYFRDEILPDTTGAPARRYRANPDGDVLGEAQWRWLANELSDTSTELFIVGSSIQLIPEEHGWEKWANFPKARKQFLELVQEINPNALFIISGDRHIAEISEQPIEDLEYPLVDFTSSGLTHTWSEIWEEPNQYRQGELIAKLNYGLLTIRFDEKITVKMEVKGVANQLYLTNTYRY